MKKFIVVAILTLSVLAFTGIMFADGPTPPVEDIYSGATSTTTYGG